MSNREMEALNGLFQALPKLDDFSLGRIIGISEGMADQKERMEKAMKEAGEVKEE